MGWRPLLTTMVTAAPRLSWVPAFGEVETIWPAGTFSSNASVALPSASRFSSRRALASVCVLPTSSGTA